MIPCLLPRDVPERIGERVAPDQGGIGGGSVAGAVKVSPRPFFWLLDRGGESAFSGPLVLSAC